MTIPSPLGSLGIIFQYLKHISVPSDHLYKFISVGLADWQQTVQAAQASQWAQPAKKYEIVSRVAEIYAKIYKKELDGKEVINSISCMQKQIAALYATCYNAMLFS